MWPGILKSISSFRPLFSTIFRSDPLDECCTMMVKLKVPSTGVATMNSVIKWVVHTITLKCWSTMDHSVRAVWFVRMVMPFLESLRLTHTTLTIDRLNNHAAISRSQASDIFFLFSSKRIPLVCSYACGKPCRQSKTTQLVKTLQFCRRQAASIPIPHSNRRFSYGVGGTTSCVQQLAEGLEQLNVNNCSLAM